MISYKPLFKTLIDLNMSKEELRKRAKLGSNTMAKINPDDTKAKYVSMAVIDKICAVLNVPVEKVIAYVPGEQSK